MPDQELRILHNDIMLLRKEVLKLQQEISEMRHAGYFNVASAAQYAGVSKHTIYSWIRRDVDPLNYDQPEAAGAVMIKKTDLINFIQRNSRKREKA